MFKLKYEKPGLEEFSGMVQAGACGEGGTAESCSPGTIDSWNCYPGSTATHDCGPGGDTSETP